MVGRLVRGMWVGLALCQGCSSCGSAGTSDLSVDAGTGPDAADDAGGVDAGVMGCLPGAFRCDGSRALDCDAPDDPMVDCASQGLVCTVQLGCAACQPLEQTCQDGKATWCTLEGELFEYDCDELQGLSCEADGCRGECALPELTDSYIGCDYYPTVTMNPVWSGFAFAIAVSNASQDEAVVTVTRGDSMVDQVTVAGGQLEIIELPWVDELKRGDVDACQSTPAPGASSVVQDGAYRVRSNEPITVYQFSPLRYVLDPAPAECPVIADCPAAPDGAETRCLSYSNDASLLLPATALTGAYTALSWPALENRASFVAVTATEDQTRVEFFGDAVFDLGDVSSPVTLDRGDVLQLVSAHGQTNGYGVDASGTRVRADKPVQVLSGNGCAQVPTASTNNCDHIEHVMLPEDTLGSTYFVTFPKYVDDVQPAPHVVRVLPIEPDTQVRFEPPLVPSITLSPGGGPLDVVMDLTDVTDLYVEGDKPIIVAQYMQGQGALPSGFVGDPSMSLAPPIEQWRSDYLFTAPTQYVANFANVIAPVGAAVSIDGNSLPESDFEPIGDSGFAVARVLLSGTSVHTLQADEEVGLVVYGYGLFTSYMYPGGMDLERITIPPIL